MDGRTAQTTALTPQVTLEAGDTWEQVLVRMTKAQAAALEGETIDPPPAARGVGTDHKGHHGSQG